MQNQSKHTQQKVCCLSAWTRIDQSVMSTVNVADFLSFFCVSRIKVMFAFRREETPNCSQGGEIPPPCGGYNGERLGYCSVIHQIRQIHGLVREMCKIWCDWSHSFAFAEEQITAVNWQK